VKEEGLAQVRRAFADVLRRKGHVSVVDVLAETGRLAPADLEAWRAGRVPYLERVVHGSLERLSAILREIERTARAGGLEPGEASFGRSARRLRFSKHGDPRLEQAYGTCWTSARAHSKPSQAAPADATSDCPAGVPGAAQSGLPAAAGLTRRHTVLQSGVRVERDPAKVRHRAAAKRDEHLALRAFLKWGPLAPAEVDRLFRRLNAEVSAEVDCTQCGACCAELSPVLDGKDVQRMCRRLRVSDEELRATLLRRTGEGFVFARQPCPLLDGTRCSCYKGRPADCRAYPHLHKKHVTGRLLDVLGNAAVCPIAFGVLQRLSAELDERGLDWRRGAPPA
jgi:hypothetical protein